MDEAAGACNVSRRRSMTCKHLYIRYEEPDGPTSRGRCAVCGRFMPSLPNATPHKKYRWHVRPDNVTEAINQRKGDAERPRVPSPRPRR